MALYNYEIALGHDADLADFDNFETWFSCPLTAPARVPASAVTTKALSGHEVSDGWQVVTLRQLGDPYGVSLLSELEDYIDEIHSGDWYSDDIEVTLRTRDRDGAFIYLNCLAHLPIVGRDYQHITSTEISDLAIRYTVIGEATVS